MCNQIPRKRINLNSGTTTQRETNYKGKPQVFSANVCIAVALLFSCMNGTETLTSKIGMVMVFLKEPDMLCSLLVDR